MKKTYAFKPLCLLVIIFDAILSISLWRMLSIVGNFLTALTSLSSILRVLLFYLLGVLGVVVMTVFLYLYYVKIEKAKGILLMRLPIHYLLFILDYSFLVLEMVRHYQQMIVCLTLLLYLFLFWL